LEIDKGVPTAGNIYFATDSGKIYVGNGSSYILESPALTGDVTKPVGSTVTSLANVNPNIGTFGAGLTIPQFTVNAKGLITGVVNIPLVIPPPSAPGSPGEIVWNNGGALDGLVTGTPGQVLSTDGTNPIWTNAGPFEFIWHFGDASPKFLMNVPADKAVLTCSIKIFEAMDGAGAALSVGSASTYNDIMDTTDNMPTELSVWSNDPDTIYSVNTDIFLSITPGSGATAGHGLIQITVQI
jgi:hypothetical protein